VAVEAGPIDILVKSAAAFDVGPTVGQDRDANEQSFATNVRAPYFLTASLVEHMVERALSSTVR
jgi:NAD(P)-dependent dehydrogenase (short-subunit alcohol dehydrogenase family)